MKKLLDVIEEMKRVIKEKKTDVLATLVQATGTKYRRPGARMLMSQVKAVGFSGIIGLENELRKHSPNVMDTGIPMLLEYGVSARGNLSRECGPGCGEKLTILLEPLVRGISHDFVDFFVRCLRDEENGVLATVFKVEGELSSRVGDRLMLTQDGLKGQNGKGELMDAVFQDARMALDKGRSLVKHYEFGTGTAWVLLESLRPMPLVIFGARNETAALTDLAKKIGWCVTLVDSTQSATPEIFPQVDALIVCEPSEILDQVPLCRNTVAVVMTYNYLQDLKILETLLPSAVRYLGIMGPRQRTERLLRNLSDQGVVATPGQLQRLYNPVGIDIGAESPVEIAVSVIAEIEAFLSKRPAGFLRDRKGPIHE